MPSDLKLTDAEIVEVLAVKGMGWTVRGDWFLTPKRTDGDWVGQSSYKRHTWNPLADPAGMGPIREVEARLTEAQRSEYLDLLEEDSIRQHGCRHSWDIRHASPRVCCEALCRVFQEGA